MKVCFVMGVLCAILAQRISAANVPTQNPYEVIVKRNVFGLNPEPPPPVDEPAKPDLPDIKLSGFVEVGGSTRALFALMPKDAKAQPIYYNLAEGEIDGTLQVVKIDFKNQEADIIDAGTPMRLTMKQNGFSETPPKTVAHNPAGNARQIPTAGARAMPVRRST